MKVRVSGLAWMPRGAFSPVQYAALKGRLTIHPQKIGDHPGETPSPIYLFHETDYEIGVPRQFFLDNQQHQNEILWDITEGSKGLPPLKFHGTLRPEQQRALDVFMSRFRAPESAMVLGGLLKAPPAFGKTVSVCALISALGVPALVVVHKDFLMTQWEARIRQFLPDAQVGFAQQDRCDFQGKHIVLGMLHSLAARDYGAEFSSHFGLVVADELHHLGAQTWANVPAKFRAKWRIGVSGTPKRKDGADNAFLYTLGNILFTATEQRMVPKVRKVWTTFRPYVPPGVQLDRVQLISQISSNHARNALVAEQIILATHAGRKILVVSERLKHLSSLETELIRQWTARENSTLPTIGYYVGGMKRDDLAEAETKQVIFATRQFAEEGLDIPALDTLVLTIPQGDVVQMLGRILRPFEGKKDPVVVDVRDDLVGYCRRAAHYRDRYYSELGVAT